jgi:galacturan 1,4-alpha-galacturonidase
MQGTIKASTNLGKYKSDAWVEFYGVSGLRMSGGGTFDGQGAATWSQNSCSKKKNCQALPVVCISIMYMYIVYVHYFCFNS